MRQEDHCGRQRSADDGYQASAPIDRIRSRRARQAPMNSTSTGNDTTAIAMTISAEPRNEPPRWQSQGVASMAEKLPRNSEVVRVRKSNGDPMNSQLTYMYPPPTVVTGKKTSRYVLRAETCTAPRWTSSGTHGSMAGTTNMNRGSLSAISAIADPTAVGPRTLPCSARARVAPDQWRSCPGASSAHC